MTIFLQKINFFFDNFDVELKCLLFFLNQGGEAEAKGRHKRKRKIRLPKNFDKNVARTKSGGLPKRERLTYKKEKTN